MYISNHYIKSLISWDTNIHEPVFTCSISNEDLKDFYEKPLLIPEYKIHTQSTERAIKNVTEAAFDVAGADARDGFVRAKMKNRSVVTSFRTIKDILQIFVSC